MTRSCESCLMPFDKDPGKRESDRYCSLCYRDGKLCYPGNDIEEFQRAAYERMRERGINPVMARLYTFMIRFAPRWRRATP
jgi:CRISPR/Cas system-associated protein Cas10 (large subunit of type III CRISPR-Cas system)